MKRILKEPLVHFLVLGALLFAGYGVLNHNGALAPGRIVISQGQLASMSEAFMRTWQRPPTDAELEGMIRDGVREEVYCREAIALGLDQDDIVIRRRLQQKMEFVFEDIATQTEPTDTELSAYLQTHSDQFRVEPQFTFRQLYLNPDKHGTNLASDVAQLRAKLNQPGGDVGFAALGDSFLLENNFAAVPASEIGKQFGETFTAKLVELPPGQWQGPVESGFGVHLVFISERTESRVPALAEVRDAVSREWESNRRQEANEKFYQDLLKHYTVIIEPPVAAEKDKKVAVVK